MNKYLFQYVHLFLNLSHETRNDNNIFFTHLNLPIFFEVNKLCFDNFQKMIKLCYNNLYMVTNIIKNTGL